MKTKRTVPTPFLGAALACAVASCSGAVPTSRAERMTRLASAQQALTAAPTAANHIALGEAYASLGRHGEAVREFEAAAAMEPGSAVPHSHLCMENNVLQQWDRAIRHCELALLADPSRRALRNARWLARRARAVRLRLGTIGQTELDRGMTHYLAKEWAQAQESWMVIPPGSPFYAMARNNLATLFIGNRDFVRGRAAIDEALRLEPENELFRNNAAWLQREAAAGSKDQHR